MEMARFEGIVERQLLPMFPGVWVEKSALGSSSRQKLASYLAPGRIAIKPVVDASYRIVLRQAQRFSPYERYLIGEFVGECSALAKVEQEPYFDDLVSLLGRRVVARATSLDDVDLILSILQQFEAWAAQTYEGQSIVAGIGIDPAGDIDGPDISTLWDSSIGPVLSNGVDTIVICNAEGKIQGLEHPSPAAAGFAPHRMMAVANWTANGRIAVCLNRRGEILIFVGGALLFARRRGGWRYFQHEITIQSWSAAWSAPLRRAVYESCLDVSFARTGACIAITSSKGRPGAARMALQDIIAGSSHPRAEILKTIIKDRCFQELDRQIRQELLAMDGATLLSHQGEILTAGAIVEIPGGSQSGGRRAAAEALSKHGLGIKVSADGNVEAFASGQEIYRGF